MLSHLSKVSTFCLDLFKSQFWIFRLIVSTTLWNFSERNSFVQEVSYCQNIQPCKKKKKFYSFVLWWCFMLFIKTTVLEGNDISVLQLHDSANSVEIPLNSNQLCSSVLQLNMTFDLWLHCVMSIQHFQKFENTISSEPPSCILSCTLDTSQSI